MINSTAVAPLCAALLAAFGASACAQARPPFPEGLGISLSTELRNENNPFRLAPGASPQVILGSGDKSDQLSIYNLGLRYDKTWSLQRIELALDHSAYRYQSYKRFDFNATGHHAAWHWQVTPRLTGVLSSSKTQSLRSYADFSNLSIRNIHTEERQLLSADWSVGAGWHLVGGVAETRSRNSESIVAVGDDVRRGAEAGVRLVTRGDNSVALVFRQARGHYEGRSLDPVSRLDSGFDDREIEVRGKWTASGHLVFDGRLAHPERKHDHFPERDFSGPVGRLGGTWMIGDKAQLKFSATRQMQSYQELANSYFVSRELALMPVWALTSKVSVLLRLEQAERDYRGPLAPVSPMRKDTIRSAQLGIDWIPRDPLLIQAYLQDDRRMSNYSGFNYRARSVGVRAQLKF